MKTIGLALVTILALTFGSQPAHAFPLTSKTWTQKQTLSPFYTPGFNFQGIVALSNCSGSIVRFKSSKDSDMALLLTNGHCVSMGPFGGLMEPGQVIVDQPAQYRIQVLDKNGATLQSYMTRRILYATMTSTDVDLMELAVSYGDLQKQTGTPALTLADSVPAMNMNIQIPSGYWKRTYACQTEAIIPTLKEAGYTFKNSIRFSQPGCETIGGTSGSPLVSEQTGEVIGINNTGNEDGEECTLNNPCEVDEKGQQTARQGRSYGQQTYLFYGCLGQGANRIDLNQPTCLLPKP